MITLIRDGTSYSKCWCVQTTPSRHVQTKAVSFFLERTKGFTFLFLVFPFACAGGGVRAGSHSLQFMLCLPCREHVLLPPLPAIRGLPPVLPHAWASIRCGSRLFEHGGGAATSNAGPRQWVRRRLCSLAGTPLLQFKPPDNAEHSSQWNVMNDGTGSTRKAGDAVNPR